MSPATYLTEQPRDPTRPWAPSPFRRLARTHAFSVAGDAIFTTTIAGLVFFNVADLNQARWQVALALVFTFLPFTLAAPFIGPLIDRARGGRKWMIVGLSGLRAVVCFALILTRGNALALYPLFLGFLVLSKGYVIARGTIVPTTVRSDSELVEANSKLSAISGFAAVAGGGPSLLIMKVAGDLGPDLALGLAGIVFVVSAVLAGQLPAARTAALPPNEQEEVELESEGIRHAARSVAFARGVVGFLTFMLAFYFKDLEGNEGLVGIGVSVVGAQIGFMVGAWGAPRARKVVSEERMLMIALGITAVTGVLTALMGAVAGAALLSFGVGLASNAAKQAFDALVQRDAPDANRGRAFARFETRFQLIWVVGALIPVAITIPIQVGFTLIAIGSVISFGFYYVNLRRVVAEARRKPSPLAGEPELVEPRLPSRSFLRGRRAERARRRDDTGTLDPTNPDQDGDGVHDATGFAIDPTLDPEATTHRNPAPVDPRVQGLDPGPDADADATTVAADPALVAAVGTPRWGAEDATAVQPVPVVPAVPDDVPGAPAPVAGRREGLFADISDHGLDPRAVHEPAEGLFAVPEPPPAPPAPPPGPVLIDTEAWFTEDALDDPTGPPAARVPDPGPPSLVPPAPEPPPRVSSYTDPGPGDSGEFYGAPSDAAVYRPPPPAPPPARSSSQVASPSRTATADAADADATADEATAPAADIYQDPPWRDSSTPPLPGFEPDEDAG